MGQHPSHRSPAAGLLSCQLFTDCCSKKRGRYWAVKMALSQPFLGTLLKWNKSTHFLNISISYIFYIIYFWINLHLHIVPIYLELVFCFVFCIAGTKKEQTATVSYFLQASNILSMQITSSFTMMQWKASMVISTTAKTNCTWF